MVDESASIPLALLDPQALNMLFGLFDNQELVNELINDFLKEAAAMITDLETLAKGRNAQKLRYIAHSLKGSSLTYGAATVGQLCKMLEETIQLGQNDNIPAQIAQLKAEFLKVESALREEQTKTR